MTSILAAPDECSAYHARAWPPATRRDIAGEAAVIVGQPHRLPLAGWWRRLAPLAGAVVLAACGLQGSPSTAPSSATPSAFPSASATSGATATAEPTSDPSHLTLPAPTASEPIDIGYTVSVDLAAGASGKLVIVVTNRTQTMVPELVLRWPTAVRDTVFLAPFEPSKQRIREGGDPLVQAWTSWVDGPGEEGEPAGTTSLGWGPLLPGGELTIPVLATRVAPGPLTFDLQILDGERVLLSDGAPVWTQVAIP
jgi:hypothetical protein